MELTGKVKYIGEIIQASEKFKKRDLVITTDSEGKYPQHISVQCTNDKCVMLDNLATGQEVKAFLNIRGREWTAPSGEVKYFNTLECWKLEVVGGQVKQPTPVVSDDLPF